MKKAFLLLILAVLALGPVSSLHTTTVIASPDTQTKADVTCYLPMIAYQACEHLYAGSQFSLQIAADHQLTAAGGAPLTAFEQAQAQAKIDAAYPTLAQALKDSGAGWTRLYLKWELVEPNAPIEGQAPAYNWRYYDEKYKIVADTGVKMIMTVSNAPSWAAVNPCLPIYKDRYDDFARFLTDLVNRYKLPPYNVKHWELINEPDNVKEDGYRGGLGCWGNSAEEYAEMLSFAYPAIKAADPEATVLMGGIAHDWFTYNNGRFQRLFPDWVMRAGGANYADTLTLHYFPDFYKEWERWLPSSYERRKPAEFNPLPAPSCGDVADGLEASYESSGYDVATKVTHFRNRMQTCFKVEKPIWITELAEHGYGGYPDWIDQQARYIIQGHVRALSAGVINITWYALATVNDNYEQGLLYDDWSPKPAFSSYQALTSELQYYRYAYTGTLDGGEVYVFQNGCGTEKFVAWDLEYRQESMFYRSPAPGEPDPVPPDTNPSLVLTGSKVRMVNYLNVESFIDDGGAGDLDQAVNGSITVEVDKPVFLQIVAP